MQTSPRIPPAGPVMATLAVPSCKTVHPAAWPNPNCGSTQFSPLGVGVTTRVMGQSVWSPGPACGPLLSVAVNVMTYVPTSAAVGVQAKVLLTGLPLVGKAGVRIALAGSPATFKLTVCPGSASDACTVKLWLLPRVIGVVEPHASPDWGGGSKRGGLQF